MATRITRADWIVGKGQTGAMERAIAVSGQTVGSTGLYSSIVTTAPGEKTRVHHHGPCETSIYVLSGRARYNFGPTGTEATFDAEAGDFVFIPAGESHVEANASTTETLVVLLSRNCPDSHNVYPFEHAAT